MSKKKDNASSEDGIKLIARNKRAFHQYEVVERLECGIVLHGSEVKSLRDGNLNFADSYALIRDGDLRLIGLNIGEYRMANRFNHEATASRKLLAHKRQIRKLKQSVETQGMTLVPLDMHWRRGMAKVELGLVRGKAQYDKRATLKDRETARTRERYLKRH